MKAKGIDHMEKREQIKRILSDYAEQQTNRTGGGAFGREEPTRLQKTLDQYAEEIEQLKLHAELETARMDIGILLGNLVAHQDMTETPLGCDDAEIVKAIREKWEPNKNA
jgi:hypothetical protein